MKIRKEYFLDIGLVLLFIQSIAPAGGDKPRVLFLLVVSAIAVVIAPNKAKKAVKQYRRVCVSVLMLIIILVIDAIQQHGYEIMTVIVYSRAYYILPIAIITFISVPYTKTTKRIMLMYAAIVVIQHVIRGAMGHYISHHMSNGVSVFPGIVGHYHNSYIACFALILAVEVFEYGLERKGILNTIANILTIILIGIPILGMLRGAILVNMFAVSVYLLIGARMRIRGLHLLYTMIALMVLYQFYGAKISEKIASAGFYGYTETSEVLNITDYSEEENYAIREMWFQYTINNTIRENFLFGSRIANIGANKFANIGSMSGRLMHSYYTGSLQDGGVALLLAVLICIVYPIVVLAKKRRLRYSIKYIIWIVALSGTIASNTWMYGQTPGTIIAYMIAFAAAEMLRDSRKPQIKVYVS